MNKVKSHKWMRIFFYINYIYLISSIIFPSSDNYGTTSEYGFKRVIPQLMSALVIMVSIYSLKDALSSRNKTINTYYIFALYTLFNYLFFVYENRAFSLYFFSQELKILVWILPIYYLYISFLYNSKNDIHKYLRPYIIIYVVYILISIVQEYAFRQNNTIEILDVQQGVYSGGAIVFLLPIFFAIFNKRISTYFFLITLGISIITAKRTPIILTCVFGLFQIKDIIRSLRKKDYIILSIFISIITTFLLASYWEMLINRNQIDMERGGAYGSGREVFYAIVLNAWQKSDFLPMMFGHGDGSVHALLLKKYGMAISSHNGFLDCVYVYGLIGLIIYISIFITLYKYKNTFKRHSRMRRIFLAYIAMWLCQNLIIHGFSGPNMIPYGIFVAYAFAMNQKSKVTKLSQKR